MNDAEFRCWLALRRHTQCARLTAQQLLLSFDPDTPHMLANLIDDAASVEAAIAATLQRRRQT